VNPEPVNPEPVNPEPVNPEPVNPEPVNPEPVNPEPVKAEAVDTDTTTTSSAPTKRMLYRHPTDRQIGGVCGGLGDLLGWDANLVRILWVVATLATGGGGILAYVALWALLPVGTARVGQVRPAALELNERNLGLTAVALIGMGILWLLANVGVLPWLWSGFWRVMSVVFWPALLIGAGYLLLRYTGRGEFNWRAAGERMKSQVDERMPKRESMRESFQAARARFPLQRSRTDRIFMGVCGGIGQRVGIDANLVRLVWAAFSVGSIGVGVLIYVLAGLFLPEAPLTDGLNGDEGQPVQVIDVRTRQV
jgi:phage shock protein PspC (stress-responsive transcriptional regulator)